MFRKIKNLLGRVLPVPARSFHRQMGEVLGEMRSLQKSIVAQSEKLEAQLLALDKKTDAQGKTINKTISAVNKKVENKSRWFNDKVNMLDGKYSEKLNTLDARMNAFDAKLNMLDARMNAFDAKLNTLDAKIMNRFNAIDYFKRYEYYKNLNPREYPWALKDWYEKRTGGTLNLASPQTYNEKIQWMKLYDSTPLKTKLADKYVVREWVKEKIGEQYLVPLLGAWERYEDINFDTLPDSFALKCNHGYAWNLIVKNKKAIDHADAKAKFDQWMNINFAFVGLELHYKDIPPMIIAEEYIENIDGDIHDYKIWCFDGKPEYIQFLCERQKGLKMAFFDTSWELLPFVYDYPQNTEPVSKPDNLDEMLQLAATLSKGFAHVRVDFYRLNDGAIKFGEMTFTSANGQAKWNPPEYDLILGQKINLPDKGV